ncbi:hypothetical protein [Pseudanabaena sp. FACHB-2040]|uniref:hypothetical protein n=1 Tax=Pseudanabaena sp. FACHB-2040 TaxID=2692859 RepID=UPI0016842C25|nr:hypothetical protein [Pseudanabaena sp. FACHB-2040]MBD2259727.1 hypothetical protein [Pseudanabaena sp. FACHB-2040]
MAILQAFLQILQVLEWSASFDGKWLAGVGLYLLWWQVSGASPILASYSLIALGLILWFCQQESEY